MGTGGHLFDTSWKWTDIEENNCIAFYVQSMDMGEEFTWKRCSTLEEAIKEKEKCNKQYPARIVAKITTHTVICED